mmetsp:Transcript_8607/g.21706  ORF Transcript_8607/g.21706 Transcript_8607/m.21706 type:complete len:330 (+) Transcript_8607:2122-3111(+)
MHCEMSAPVHTPRRCSEPEHGLNATPVRRALCSSRSVSPCTKAAGCSTPRTPKQAVGAPWRGATPPPAGNHLLATPKRHSAFFSRGPPDPPSHRRLQCDLEDDVAWAMGCESIAPLVSVICRRHACPKNHALHEAIARCEGSVVERLLAGKVQGRLDINDVCTATNSTPLSAAVMMPILAPYRLQLIETLLRHGADPNCSKSGENVLCLAIAAGCTASVEMLLRYGAKATMASPQGATPMHVAAPVADAFVGDVTPIMHLLLKAGADPSAVDTKGRQPIELCSCPKIVNFLATECLWRRRRLAAWLRHQDVGIVGQLVPEHFRMVLEFL